MEIILLSLIIPLLALIFESYPRFLNREFGVDIWTHLLYLKEYHKQKGIPRKIEDGFLVSGTYDYPPAFIFILSKFPFRLVEKYEFLFSPFFDAIHLILIYIIAYYLTGNIIIALLTQFFYTLTPIIILENSSATPRSMGYTLFTIVLISLFLFNINGSYIYLLSAVISGSLIFLSHRFTAQGFLFFSIFLTILQRNFIYSFVFIVCFIFALILSKGFYIKVLKGHMGNLIFWYKNINFRFAHQVKGNYEEYKTKDFIFRLYNQFLKFPPFIFAITNPWTLPSIFIILLGLSATPITKFMLAWVIFSYILALLTTWIPKLRFLGEGQRYLELSAFPAAFLSSLLLISLLKTNYGSLAVILYSFISLASLITIIVIQRKGIIKEKLRTLTPGMKSMFKYLKNMKNKPDLLCIPHQITTNTIYHTDCRVFVNADYAGINKISEVYPYFTKPIPEVMKKYRLDMILLNSDYAKIEDLKLRKYVIIKNIDNFFLIKI